jgi:hypothetical protein
MKDQRITYGSLWHHLAHDNDVTIDLHTQTDITLIANNPVSHLHDLLVEYSGVDILTQDGAWTSPITVPAASTVTPGRRIHFSTQATWNVNIQINNLDTIFTTGSSAHWIAINGLWKRVI